MINDLYRVFHNAKYVSVQGWWVFVWDGTFVVDVYDDELNHIDAIEFSVSPTEDDVSQAAQLWIDERIA